MRNVQMRKAVRRLHLWFGLSLGGLFVLLGLTGSALVFYVDIDRWLHPEIQVSANAEPDWDRALATVRAAFPDKRGPWRFEVTGDGGAIPARYYNPPETAGQGFAPMMVWLSPDGSDVQRRDYWGDYAMTFIYDLHYRLLAGETGGIVLGYMGLALFVLLLSGLWSWWPRAQLRKSLRYKSTAPPVRKLRDQHKLVGLAGFPVLILLTVTGVMLALPKESNAVLGKIFGPIDTTPAPASKTLRDKPILLSHAMYSASKALPQARISWVETPGEGDGVFCIRMAVTGDPSARFPHSFVWIDQYDGRVLAITDARNAGITTTINNWIHPLHDGSFGGLGMRLLSFLIGLFPLWLFLTGFKRWCRRSA